MATQTDRDQMSVELAELRTRIDQGVAATAAVDATRASEMTSMLKALTDLTAKLDAVVKDNERLRAEAVIAEQHTRIPREPEFKDGDSPEQFCFLVEGFLSVYTDTPAFTVLQSAFQQFPDALGWLMDERERDELLHTKPWATLKPMFLERFAPKNLLAPCRVDYQGAEFETLDALVQHAIGEAKRQKEQNPARIALNQTFAARTARPKRPSQWVKKPNNNKRRKTENATSNGAGPSNPRPMDGTKGSGMFSPFLGRELTVFEWEGYRKNGMCVKCGQKGHIASKCGGKDAAKGVAAMEVEKKDDA
ncbi:hypothetical protein PLESTF_001973700 [Pleodorina starrii]|nr:hypothetical protein PLESTF_001973700 [Pleodorina starrii]